MMTSLRFKIGAGKAVRAGLAEENQFIKVGVVGVGRVGGDAALNMALRDSCREMVLIDAHYQLAVSQALGI
jgi:tRNA A37 threonylcarbamoyladenosine dehydratase